MTWAEANHRYLAASIDAIHEALVHHRDGTAPEPTSTHVQDRLNAARAEMGDSDAAINRLVAVFGLSEFERDVLLLAAGFELDAGFADTCRSMSAPGSTITFSLALGALASGHWSALSPAGPLRYWKMIDVAPSESLASASLRIDERILHYLTGLDFLDERLQGYVERVDSATPLAPSQQHVADRLARLLVATDNERPVLQLAGPDTRSSLGITEDAARQVGLLLYRMRDRDIPGQVGERTLLVRLWEREVALSGRALVIQHEDQGQAAVQLIESMHSVVVLVGRGHLDGFERPSTRLEVHRPSPDEQADIWLSALPKAARPTRNIIAALVRHFDLSTEEIMNAATAYVTDPSATVGIAGLWHCAQTQARSGGDSLASRVQPKATWDDLVLPERHLQMLRRIAEQVRHRSTVYDEWGFADRETRGLGITALFTGRSGTGKTMAAEVLANELDLDLFRIDLSTVVSKYIGDTEKNLRKVFDAAEKGGAILLFDEADALFGKRSEVKDSHDRFANIEVSYLLQRMEDYRGLAILTSNLRDAIDPAFVRRIRFILDFRFPDAALRERMWDGAFPKATPTFDLKPELLAELAVAGGNIRNVALNAAFVAASEGTEVTMTHLAQAARDEFAKLDQTLPEKTLKGWT